MAKCYLSLGGRHFHRYYYPGRYMATVLPTETVTIRICRYSELKRQLRAKQVSSGKRLSTAKNFGMAVLQREQSSLRAEKGTEA